LGACKKLFARDTNGRSNLRSNFINREIGVLSFRIAMTGLSRRIS